MYTNNIYKWEMKLTKTWFTAHVYFLSYVSDDIFVGRLTFLYPSSGYSYGPTSPHSLTQAAK